MRRKMKKKEKNFGFLLFYDWFDLFYDLSPKHYKMLMNAMVFYQRHGTPPPEFPDKIKKIANLIFAQLDRRIANSENGRLGGEAKARAQRKTAPPLTAAVASEDAPPMVYRKDKEEIKNSQEEKKQDNKYLLSDESAYLCGSYEPHMHRETELNQTQFGAKCREIEKKNEDAETRNARKETENQLREPSPEGKVGSLSVSADTETDEGQQKCQTANEDIGLRAYGIHNNVLLSEGEYRVLKSDIPNADEYINIFSDKLVKKGYRYRDHYAAIRSWWERDKQYADAAQINNTVVNHAESGDLRQEHNNSTFVPDEFFAAALRRSEEILNKYCIY